LLARSLAPAQHFLKHMPPQLSVAKLDAACANGSQGRGIDVDGCEGFLGKHWCAAAGLERAMATCAHLAHPFLSNAPRRAGSRPSAATTCATC
jgi:hypothetical protein